MTVISGINRHYYFDVPILETKLNNSWWVIDPFDIEQNNELNPL